MIHLEIDGRAVRAPEGSTVLQAARAAGVAIPTLCHHEALEAWGGCRLCSVEVGHPDWSGWTDLVVSCLYPAREGLRVQTASPLVLQTRRTILDLLLARCPDAEEIRRLAAEHGVTRTSFVEAELENRRCILCSLCVRVCHEVGADAIGTAGRGQPKRIAPPFDQPAAACVGCFSCVRICPTDAIEHEEAGTTRTIWGRTFEVIACEGCGAPLSTEEHVQLDVKRSGLGRDWFTHCPACKRKRTAETIRATFTGGI